MFTKPFHYTTADNTSMQNKPPSPPTTTNKRKERKGRPDTTLMKTIHRTIHQTKTTTTSYAIDNIADLHHRYVIRPRKRHGRSKMLQRSLIIVLSVLWTVWLVMSLPCSDATSTKKPNVYLVDDQEEEYDEYGTILTAQQRAERKQQRQDYFNKYYSDGSSSTGGRDGGHYYYGTGSGSRGSGSTDNRQWNSFTNDDNTLPTKHYGRPRNILESIWKSVLVGSSMALAGTVSMIGLPLFALVYPESIRTATTSSSTSSSSADYSTTTTSSWKDRLLTVVVSGLLGGLAGATLWIGGSVWVTKELLVGLIWSTPQIIYHNTWKGNTYWNTTTGRWQPYNLSYHAEVLEMTMTHTSFGTNTPGGQTRSSKSPPPTDDTLYRLLNVSPTATQKEIKKAYYQQAKLYHPDKNPTPEGELHFRKLHAAYETLHDPDTRRTYDQYGHHNDGTTAGADATANSAIWGFDVGIFFQVLLGFSPEVEQYVGDLTVISFGRWIVDLVMMWIASQEGSPTHQQKLQQYFQQYMNDWYQSNFVKPDEENIQQESRQVDIALYLQSITKQYMTVMTTTEERINGQQQQQQQPQIDNYRQACHEEVMTVATSTVHSSFFLKEIGSTLYWECGRNCGGSTNILEDVIGIPTMMARHFGTSYRRWTNIVGHGHGLYKDYQSEVEKHYNALVDEQGKKRRGNKSMNDAADDHEELKRQARQMAFESMFQGESEKKHKSRHGKSKSSSSSTSSSSSSTAIPLTWRIMDLMWQEIGVDIRTTLKGACWKVLNDVNNSATINTTDNNGNHTGPGFWATRTQRRQRARALRILGEEFLKVASTTTTTTTTMGGTDPNDIQDENVCSATKDDASSSSSSCTADDLASNNKKKREEESERLRVRIQVAMEMAMSKGKDVSKETEEVIEKRHQQRSRTTG